MMRVVLPKTDISEDAWGLERMIGESWAETTIEPEHMMGPAQQSDSGRSSAARLINQ
jgi:hypothetical protein